MQRQQVSVEPFHFAPCFKLSTLKLLSGVEIQVQQFFGAVCRSPVVRAGDNPDCSRAARACGRASENTIVDTLWRTETVRQLMTGLLDQVTAK